MRSKNTKKTIRQIVCLLCAIIIFAGALYVANWYINKNRIEEKSEQYSAMYTPAESTPVPSPEPIADFSDEPSPTLAPMPEAMDAPIPTPDSDTLVYALPTPPPVQESFNELLAMNEDTVGFLTIDELIQLPVVQRENDNDFYLTHTFEKTESREGALFLDGMNRLVPEDDCLIIYGHNMMNDTMFGMIDHYNEQAFLEAHPLVHFDTLYENRTYVPIAAFPASMDRDSGQYFDVRQFMFDPAGFDLFMSRVKTRSVLDIPVDAYYGDRLLLLVTCNYTNNDGRFIVVLRQLRSAETEEEILALLAPPKETEAPASEGENSAGTASPSPEETEPHSDEVISSEAPAAENSTPEETPADA